jgi:hypothetical protein
MIICRDCFHENEDHYEYCENCGHHMYYFGAPNSCTNELCPNHIHKVELKEFASFCFKCGSRSTYYEKGYVHPVDHEAHLIAQYELEAEDKE